jgi:ABC-type multidrug transport system fused ATPase/permease subunit
LSYKTLAVFALLAVAAALLFSPHLLAFATFIGDSDRLNSLLNMRLFEVRSIQTLGWIPQWNENMFMGYGMAGLHWMLPSYDPLGYISSLFRVDRLFWIEGVFAAGLIALAGWSAYLFIYDTVDRVFPAFVGAFLYCFSVFSLHRDAQLDSAQLSLVLMPVGLLVLRRVSPHNLPISFLALAGLMAFLATFGFLQEVSYLFILFGLYAVYRSIAIDGFDPCPLVLIAAAGGASLIVAAPRLISVIGDFAQLERTNTFQQTDFVEFARFVHEGLFGRFQEEREIVGNGLNLHEGLQLLGSTVAALLILVGLFRPRDGWQLLGSLIIGLVLSASIIYVSPQYRAFASIFVSTFTTKSFTVPATALITNAAILGVAVLAVGIVIGLIVLLVVTLPVLVRIFLPVLVLILLPVLVLPLWRIEPYLQLMPAVRRVAGASRQSIPVRQLEAALPDVRESMAAKFRELIGGFREVITAVRQGTTFDGLDWQFSRSIPDVRQLMAECHQFIAERLTASCLPTWKLRQVIAQEGQRISQSSVALFRQLTGEAAQLIARFRQAMPAFQSSAPRTKRDRDTGFHLIILGLVLAAVLIDEAHYFVYFLFGRADFTHSRLSIVAVLPMATLTAVFLNELLPRQSEYRLKKWGTVLLVAGIACAVAGSWIAKGPVLDAIAWIVPYWLLDISANKFLPAELLKTTVAIVIFVGLMCFIIRFRKQPSVRHVIVFGLGCMMIFEAFLYGWFKINGPHTHTFPIAFRGNNYFSAPPCTLVPPTERAVSALRQRLEADNFRSVLVADMINFPAFVEPHISQFWNLRLLGGYSAANPLRLAALPWPTDAHKFRAIRFSSLENLPLSLLALLNVKYIIPVDRALYFNLAGNAAREGNPACPHNDMSPDQVTAIENPYPVTGRQFFTERIVPINQTRGFLAPGDDPAKISIVEGISQPRTFQAIGQIHAIYRGDRIVIDIAPLDEERFLVLNEMYSPGWKGYSGGVELPILATNTVMRGVIVPPGAARIEMRYEPFLTSRIGTVVYATGILGLLLVFSALSFFQDSPASRTWRIGWRQSLKRLLARLKGFLRSFFEIDRIMQLKNSPPKVE